MKFAFSTLGCPNWSFNEIISTAKDIGFDGVEIRGIEKEIYIPHSKQFSPGNIEKTLAKMTKMSLEISCLTSDCRINERFKIDDHMRSAKEYIDLASTAKVKFVRILADTSPAPGADINTAEIAVDFRELAEYAEDRNVTVLVETNGKYSDSNEMLKLLDLIGHDSVAVLWDVHHPFRFIGEPVSLTYSRLKNYIRYIHLKDSLMIDGDVRYQMMGYGDVPVAETISLLKSDGFDGYISLEWVKRWRADLAEPGVVFPHFLSYVKSL